MKLWIQTFKTFVCLLILPLTSLASEDVDENYFFEELPVVLSVSRLEQPLFESSSSVTIIDQEMISASGARDIPELLRLVPGFVVSYRDGNSPIAAYHGLGSEYIRQMQVLINGRPIYSPIFSGVFWADIPFGVDDIEKIEVIRGPNSASYGSNSFNSVISITTKQAVSSKSSNVHTKIGNNNYTETYINKALLGQDWDLSFSISRKTDDGFDNVQDSQESNKFYGTYNFNISPEQTFTTEVGALNGNRGIGTDNSLDPSRDIELNKFFTRLKWDYQNASGDAFQLQYFYDRYKTDDIFSVSSITTEEFAPAFLRQNGIDLSPVEAQLAAATSVPEVLGILAGAGFSTQQIALISQYLSFSDDQLNSTAGGVDSIDFSYFTLRQEIEFTYQPHKADVDKYRYVAGLSMRQDKQNIKQLFNRNTPLSLNQYRLFYNGEYKHEKLLFNLGLMIEDNEITGTDKMPKFSAIYSPNNNTSFRYTYSQASRSPVGLEEFSDYQVLFTPSSTDPAILAFTGTADSTVQVWQSQGDLDREIIKSNEIAFQRYSTNKHYHFEAKLFSNKIENLISLNRITGDFDNSDDLEINGAEVSFEKRNKNSRISTGFSKLDPKGDDIGDQYTESIPDHTFFFFTSYQRRNWLISSTLNHYSNIRMLDTKPTNNLTFLNLFLKYQTVGTNKRWISFTANKLIEDDFEYKTANAIEKLFNIEIGFDF